MKEREVGYTMDNGTEREREWKICKSKLLDGTVVPIPLNR